MASRIYLVTTASGEHLIEAKNPSSAIRHVTTAGVTCEAASTKDVARLMAAGVKVEVAGDEPAAPPVDPATPES